jgi:hypothetical protein
MSSKRGVDIEVEHQGNPWDGSIGQEDCGKLIRFVAGLYLRLEDSAPVEKFGRVLAEADDPILHEARVALDAKVCAPHP